MRKKKKSRLGDMILLSAIVLIVLGLKLRCSKIEAVLNPDKSPNVVQDLPKEIAKHVVPFFRDIDSVKINASATGFHLKVGKRVVLVTNKHVCVGSSSKKYARFGHRVHKIIAIDTMHDLCVLESNRKDGLTLAESGGNTLDKVILVGYPRGIGPVVREGRIIRSEMINARWLSPTGYFFVPTIRISTLATGGNSGSPVCNDKGQVIGVLFAGNPRYPLEGLIVPHIYLLTFLDRVL